MNEEIVKESNGKGEYNSDSIKILTGKRDYSNENYDRNQYYLQQNLAGQRVYVQGPPPPVNAARTPVIQPRAIPIESFDESIFYNSFNTTQIRHRFIRRVYFLLFILLAFTAGMIAVFIFEKNANAYARQYPFVGLLVLIGSFAIYITLACVQSLRKRFPLNFIVLSMFTLLSSVAYGFIAALYAPEIVLYSAAITAGVCLLLTLIACQSWIDITGWGIYLCVAGLVVILFGLIAMIITWTTGIGNILLIIYSSLIALVFSLYFVYTTQLIIGGKKYEISPEEYILGAIVLYVEVMTLFTTILHLFGMCRG